MKKVTISLLILVSSFQIIFSQNIPSRLVLDNSELVDYISTEFRYQVPSDGSDLEHELAHYFREALADRFFFNWKNTNNRFNSYDKIYDPKQLHLSRAKDHMSKYDSETKWILPFNYLNGEAVNAYALRHLARQHKMVDIAFNYFYDNKDPKYISYFVDQLNSLNTALKQGSYEKIEDGNGVYESFRAGYRVLNWLQIHHMFLGEKQYDDHAQLRTIASLLQHGSLLYEINDRFVPGNHQTRGVSALALIAMLFPEFEDSKLWLDRAILRLEEHLGKEINEDGFQFERSVHYHMSDINNYFYVYQLALINDVVLPESWTNSLNTLFTTLVKIAYPDKTTPVLQDDTEIPWAEANDISGVMTLGYLLFGDKEFGYFANQFVKRSHYWFLNEELLSGLDQIEYDIPKYGSLYFPDTRYYIMREGWVNDDKMMIISAGVDPVKPDHQHGDVLGIQAMAYGKVILPNYQVRYSLDDLELFKNSMVKNVALVDKDLQGKKWTSNKGGSGFGKFRQLPDPKTHLWLNRDDYDYYQGTHDGFSHLGIEYSRSVIFIKNEFWIIIDHFGGGAKHEFKQVWQGHYTTEEGPGLIRSNFENAVGCDIYQLFDVDNVESSGARGKQWSIVSKKAEAKHDFYTIIYPYKGYDQRIDENEESPDIGSWKMDQPPFSVSGENIKSLSRDSDSYVFKAESVQHGKAEIQFSSPADLFIKIMDNKMVIHHLGESKTGVVFDKVGNITKNGEKVISVNTFTPGDIIGFEF